MENLMEINRNIILNDLKRSAEIKLQIINNDELIKNILSICNEVINCYKNNGKVLFCGNGGSAADAQHLAAELSGKFYINREPLFAEALHVNTSYITAVANDFSYDEVFSRLVKAKGKKGDILFAISTSGNSKNIINAVNIANDIGIITIGMTGKTGGYLKNICKYLLNIPSDDTPRIQEAHITLGHIICEIVEKELFGNE